MRRNETRVLQVVREARAWLSGALPGRRRRLLTRVTETYLASGDFNGMGVSRFVRPGTVIDLVAAGLISVNRGDRHPNPHIKAFDAEPPEQQISKIRSDGLSGVLYPERAHLERVVDSRTYDGRPFSLRLARGGAQLSLAYFDLAVLENYRNDPRYYFEVDDVHGSISVSDAFYESDAMTKRDQTFLQTFGFAYDRDLNRCVCVFLRYLNDLTPEHQRIWEARELHGDYEPHPDYWRTSMGNFPEKVSVFAAFCEELRICNEMARAMGKPPLFRDDFANRRPKEFGFLLRPTLRDFNRFVHLLDQMLSDNFNRDFFRGDMPLEREEAREDGKVVVSPKGTIQLLDEWLDRIEFEDPEPRREMIETLRDVRRMRQKPAHAVEDNIFNQEYFKRQRTLALRAYRAVKIIRLILALHPATTGQEIPDWLEEGRVWQL